MHLGVPVSHEAGVGNHLPDGKGDRGDPAGRMGCCAVAPVIQAPFLINALIMDPIPVNDPAGLQNSNTQG